MSLERPRTTTLAFPTAGPPDDRWLRCPLWTRGGLPFACTRVRPHAKVSVGSSGRDTWGNALLERLRPWDPLVCRSCGFFVFRRAKPWLKYGALLLVHERYFSFFLFFLLTSGIFLCKGRSDSWKRFRCMHECAEMVLFMDHLGSDFVQLGSNGGQYYLLFMVVFFCFSSCTFL
jgi:hypothetical protein